MTDSGMQERSWMFKYAYNIMRCVKLERLIDLGSFKGGVIIVSSLP